MSKEEDYVQVPPDSSGKKVRTIKETIGGDEVHSEVHIGMLRTLADIPADKTVTKISFWEDASGNIKYIKYYDGAELLFTLEFSDAGTASAETWSVTRT